jgi:hypothetical protein
MAKCLPAEFAEPLFDLHEVELNRRFHDAQNIGQFPGVRTVAMIPKKTAQFRVEELATWGNL